MFVYEKFLKSDSSGEAEDLHSETQEPEVTESFEISEDALPDEEASPAFYVEAKNEPKPSVAMPVFKASSVEKITSAKAVSPEVEKKPEVKSSVPEKVVQDADELEAIDDEVPSPKEKVPAVEKASSPVAEIHEEQTASSAPAEVAVEEKAPASELDSELDELPDFGSVISEVSEDVADLTDSGEVYHSSSSSSSSASVDGQDADTIAKAIRTMLNGD
ncbi:MAG: hypothetical protein K6G52_06815 [Treponemataceae bacterium]|nr:hypothetical protein [Treponemataceae bacterium]